MTILFENLPRESLKLALSFLGNAPDLLSCERTCKTLHAIVADDEVWTSRNGWDKRFQSHRELLCVRQNLKYIRKHQKQSVQNPLLSIYDCKALSCRCWKTIISFILDMCLPERLTSHRTFLLRGDTVATVMAILQSFLVTSFQRALSIACGSAAEHNKYPVVKTEHLRMQDALGQTTMNARVFKHFCAHQVQFANTILSKEEREQMIRRSAFCAGITKFSDDVYDQVWTALINLILSLFGPACEELAATRDDSHQPSTLKRRLHLCLPRQTMRTIPPLPYGSPCVGCGAQTWCHTPVPKQIEDAAAKLLPVFPTRIYEDWLAESCDEYAKQTEIDQAYAQYGLGEDLSEEEDSSGEEDSSEEESEEGPTSNSNKRQRTLGESETFSF